MAKRTAIGLDMMASFQKLPFADQTQKKGRRLGRGCGSGGVEAPTY